MLEVIKDDPKVKLLSGDELIALKVLMNTRYVQNWVRSQASFLGVDLSTPGGKRFLREKSQKYSLKHLDK